MSDSSPGFARRYRRALGLAADATDLEVFAVVADLTADGFVVVKRSQLDEMLRITDAGREMAETALREQQRIREHDHFAHLFDCARRKALVDERDHEQLAAMFDGDPEGARLVMTTKWKEAL